MAEVITLSNGAQYSQDEKRIVSMKSNPEHSRAMARARWDKAAAAARQGMALAVSNAIGQDVRKQSAKSWGMIVEHLTDVLLHTDSARGAADLASFIGKAADVLPDKRQADDAPTNTVRLDVPVDALMQMWRDVREHRRAQSSDSDG